MKYVFLGCVNGILLIFTNNTIYSGGILFNYYFLAVGILSIISIALLVLGKLRCNFKKFLLKIGLFVVGFVYSVVLYYIICKVINSYSGSLDVFEIIPFSHLAIDSSYAIIMQCFVSIIIVCMISAVKKLKETK